MASSKPVIRQIAWISVIPQGVYIALLYALCKALGEPAELCRCFALIGYLLTHFLLRYLVPRNHRKGISLFKSGRYSQAIGEFEKSYAYFTRHAWIDKYRMIVLFSSSKISYREMALLNMAFCYTQLGDGGRAKEYYEEALEKFPDSEIAKSALKMLDSAADIKNGDSER